MANKKVISMGLDYSQLDGGASEITRKMGILEAQFKLTKEEMQSYATESDQLTLKQDKLTQQIILQTKKVELAKQAYDKAVEGGKASSAQIDKLNKDYINSQASLQKYNNELQENKSKLDTVNKSTTSFGDSIRGLSSSLGINVSPALETVASKFDGVDKSVGNAVLTIGAVVTALGSCTISAAATADELLELSSTSGIATDQLQKMQYASDFLDVETETMTGSITKLTRSMNSARNGTTELDDAFKKIGVRYKDNNGVLLDSEEVFYKTIDALGKVKNETERDALAMQLMGKSAKDLNPLIEAGSQRLKELGIEAENMGLIMGEDTLNDLGAFQDSMDKLNNTFENVKLRLGTALLPVLQVLVDLISGIPAPVLSGIVVFAALTAILMSLAKTFSTVAASQALLSAANISVGSTGMVATAGMGPLLLILLAIAAVIAIIVGGTVALKGALKDAEDAGKNAINGATEVANTINNVPKTTSRAIGYANGTKNAFGGMAWVGEAGPELINVPIGSQVFANSESKGMIGGNTYISVTVPIDDLKQITDVAEWANGLKQRNRQGVLRLG